METSVPFLFAGAQSTSVCHRTSAVPQYSATRRPEGAQKEQKWRGSYPVGTAHTMWAGDDNRRHRRPENRGLGQRDVDFLRAWKWWRLRYLIDSLLYLRRKRNLCGNPRRRWWRRWRWHMKFRQLWQTWNWCGRWTPWWRSRRRCVDSYRIGRMRRCFWWRG